MDGDRHLRRFYYKKMVEEIRVLNIRGPDADSNYLTLAQHVLERPIAAQCAGVYGGFGCTPQAMNTIDMTKTAIAEIHGCNTRSRRNLAEQPPIYCIDFHTLMGVVDKDVLAANVGLEDSSAVEPAFKQLYDQALAHGAVPVKDAGAEFPFYLATEDGVEHVACMFLGTAPSLERLVITLEELDSNAKLMGHSLAPSEAPAITTTQQAVDALNSIDPSLASQFIIMSDPIMDDWVGKQEGSGSQTLLSFVEADGDRVLVLRNGIAGESALQQVFDRVFGPDGIRLQLAPDCKELFPNGNRPIKDDEALQNFLDLTAL